MSVKNLNLSVDAVADSGAAMTISFSGVLDENAKELLFQLKGQLLSVSELVINTSGIIRINSIGMSHFSRFIQDLQDKKIEYISCSGVFMDFVIMVPGVFTGAAVTSFYGNYYCQTCDEEFSVLINSQETCFEKLQICKNCQAEARACGALEDIQSDGVLPEFMSLRK